MTERLYWCNKCYSAVVSDKPIQHCGRTTVDIGWVESKTEGDNIIKAYE